MMLWTLVFIVKMQPLDMKSIGYFDSYEKCHQEAVWQTKESGYFDNWACVQTEAKISNKQERVR